MVEAVSAMCLRSPPETVVVTRGEAGCAVFRGSSTGLEARQAETPATPAALGGFTPDDEYGS
ncbi:hypothetical protein BGP79_03265 [Tersicoccus sp. Bi-70]|nr:hypothetical protein BGP79_03265 [Tersicoccus sp. Bi-70]